MDGVGFNKGLALSCNCSLEIKPRVEVVAREIVAGCDSQALGVVVPHCTIQFSE